MKTLSLSEVARAHCAASRPRMNLRGFVTDNYKVGLRFFEEVALGKKNPSKKLLSGIETTQVRLFPSEPVTVRIPNFPVEIRLGVQSSTNR